MIDIAKRIDQIVNNYEKALDEVLQKASKEIAGVVAGLDIKAGKILSTTDNLKKISNMQSEVLTALNDAGFKELTESYIRAYDAIIDDLQELYKKQGLNKFVQADIDKIVVLQGAIIGQYEGLASEVVATISQQVSKVAVGSGTFQSAIANIEKSLEGNFKKYALTYAKTSLGDFTATVTKFKSQEVGVKRYRYEGHLQDNSRDCCIEWQGNEFTEQEINQLHGNMFADGSPLIEGDIFVNRGGWNCNHYWVPIL